MEAVGRISNLDALLFALSLEVALLQIKILQGSTTLRASLWRSSGTSEKLQCEKLERDRETVRDVLRRTLIDIAEGGEWVTLRKAVELLRERQSSAVLMRRNHKQLSMARSEILLETKVKREQWVTDLRNADTKIAALQDKINDDLQNAIARFNYAEKWLFARSEELELRNDVPRVFHGRSDHEQRVHDELVKAYALQIQEREDSLEHWQHRYIIDTEQIHNKVVQKCEQLRNATTRREELQKLYNLHEGEMRSWLTFKRERAARLEREERRRASATRIQAWWRGVMVRRAIGAFKFLKNAKKGSNKAKKK